MVTEDILSIYLYSKTCSHFGVCSVLNSSETIFNNVSTAKLPRLKMSFNFVNSVDNVMKLSIFMGN